MTRPHNKDAILTLLLADETVISFDALLGENGAIIVPECVSPGRDSFLVLLRDVNRATGVTSASLSVERDVLVMDVPLPAQ